MIRARVTRLYPSMCFLVVMYGQYRHELSYSLLVRDRPFNLQGGGYGFLFRSEILFRTTRELEYYFFPGFNNSLYDTKTESDFFFPPPKSEYFFSNIGNQDIFL